MSKDQFANDLELPALFDTDEPMFMTGLDKTLPPPALTMDELMAMDGAGGDAEQHEGL